MNIKITKEEHEILKEATVVSRIFGSKLYGTDTKDSDTDIMMIYDHPIFDFMDIYPNIHTLQYTDVETNTDYVHVQQNQFIKSIVSGDSIIAAEVLMFHEEPFMSNEDDGLIDIVRTYKVIKSFLGHCKRDLKYGKERLHHVKRCYYIARSLFDGKLPNIEGVRKAMSSDVRVADMDFMVCGLRDMLNYAYNQGEIFLYNIPELKDEHDSIVGILNKVFQANNQTEFTYK